MANTFAAEETGYDDSLISRLWQGKVRLVYTYWILFTMCGIAVFISAWFRAAILTHSLSHGASQFAIVTYMYVLFVIGCEALACVCVWRSAARYKIARRSRFFGYLAQASVCFRTFCMLCLVALAYQEVRTFDGQKELSETESSAQSVKEAPKRAGYALGVLKPFPVYIDDSAEISSIKKAGRDYIYHIHFKRSVHDQSAFLQQAYRIYGAAFCELPQYTSEIMDGASVSIYFDDTEKSDFHSLSVNRSTCAR